MNSPQNIQIWLDAVLDGSYRFDISFANIAGRLRLPNDWNTHLLLPEHLLYYVVEGSFEAQINQEQRHIGAGDLLWATRGSQIRFWLPVGDKLVIHRFRLQAYKPDGDILELPTPFWHLTMARSCASWMEQIVDEASYAAPHSKVRLRGLFACLLTEMVRLGSNYESSNWLTRGQRENIAHYFSRNVQRWPSPADLAQVVQLSPDYFTRCFRRTFGVAPRRWLVEERQRMAALRLLESNLNISQIAQELGYDDVFLFSRQFKAVFGVSPTQYREKHGTVGRLKSDELK
jgi:AraC-like DNA-binding protein/mannose-6-phosphate isomerase-like protein (cupin superfamily)